MNNLHTTSAISTAISAVDHTIDCVWCSESATQFYFWGDATEGDYVWYSSNSSYATHPVGEKKPNAWGLYDVNGNVWEWNADWYGTPAYGLDPLGPVAGTSRILRGGCCCNAGDQCSSVTYAYASAANTSTTISSVYCLLGFRISFTPSGSYKQPKESDDPHGGVQLWADGPFWAECNIGASTPEEYGYYFSWGDTLGYRYKSSTTWISSEGVTWNNWPYSSSTCPTCNKDVSKLQSLGCLDSANNLREQYDAAAMLLGSPWRMPTDADFATLIKNCTTTWTTYNGVRGLRVTGQGDYSTKSIFLPAAGYGLQDSDIRDRGGLYSWGGHYWSSTPCLDTTQSGGIYFSSSGCNQSAAYRPLALSIRAIRTETK